MGDRLMPATPSFGQGTPVTSRALNTAFANLQAQISSPSAGSLTGTTLAANVVNSSLTSVGTLVSGSIPATLLTGTVASARISGSYTGITGLGTLTSLTIDGPTSTAFTLGDTGFTGYSGITGDKGHLLVGNSVGDTAIYLRSSGAGNLYLGASNSNTLQVGNGTVTVYGTMNATTFSGSGSSLTSLNASNLASGTVASARLSGGYTGITGLGTLTTLLAGKVCSTATVAAANDTGSFSVRGNTSFPAVMSFHRAGAYAVNFGLSTSNVMELGGWSAGTIKFSVNMANGDVTAVGGLNAYSISGNSNVAGTGNASYHPSGIYSTGTNWLYGTVLTNGNDIGAITQYVGAVYGNNWFRSSGDTGWYSQTYGGGIWMVDSTWVQTYNGKRFYSSGGFGGTVNYGSYGSMSLYGALNGWEGITFPEVATTWMSTANGQYFGIYRNNSTWNFYVVNGTFTPSDERYKRDIEPLQHGMNFIKEIVPITFDPLTEDPSDDPEQTVGRTHYGFTTQNILQALANVGETRDVALVDIGGPANESNESDRQYLNHSGLIAPMIKAIQELDQRLQQLETV